MTGKSGSERDSEAELSTQLVSLVFVLAHALRREGDALVAPFGLTTSRWLILGALEDGPKSVAAVARGRGLSRQSVRESAAALERDGLIFRYEDPRDARAPLVELTTRGHATLVDIEPSRRRWAARTDGVLEELQWRVVLRSVGALLSHLEDPSLTAD